ncbi:MAG: hypothetical protein QXH67_00025 [Candidatus Bathyarchaeia archaeon]
MSDTRVSKNGVSEGEFVRGLPRQPMTPIPCTVCGWVGKGRWANRSTVCWRCRRRFLRELEGRRG